MTPEQRKAARERCEKATPGWKAGSQSNTADARTEDFVNAQGVRMYGRYWDCQFAAHARTDLPAALDALDAADARIAELEIVLRASVDAALKGR